MGVGAFLFVAPGYICLSTNYNAQPAPTYRGLRFSAKSSALLRLTATIFLTCKVKYDILEIKLFF